MRLALPLLLGLAPFGLVTGIAAQGAGLSLGEAALMSGSVFAGSAQLVALAHWTHPAAVLGAMLSTLAVNSRLALMGPVLAPWLSRVHGWRLLAPLFVMADQNWALSVVELQAGDGDAAFLLGSGALCWLVWVATTLLGFGFGRALHPPSGHPLFFAALAVFIALLVQMWRGGRDILPWLVAAATATAVARLLPGTTWHIVAGALAGSVAGAVRDRRQPS